MLYFTDSSQKDPQITIDECKHMFSMEKKKILSYVAVLLLCGFVGRSSRADQPIEQHLADVPKPHDSRLVVELFAAEPDIVHPIGVAFDRKGRLLVIESHTHFPPEGYQGPKGDRIRMLEDTDGDGKADRFTTFFEGTQKSMS